MNISYGFIKRPVMTTLIVFAIVVFGSFSYRLLPVASIPVVEYPVIQVTTNYPGASPDEMARLVAAPLERQFMLMQGIQIVASANTYETSTIVLQFHLDINIDVAASEVQEAITQASAQLPDDLPQSPTYTKSNPSDTPILYLVVASDSIDAAKLYDYAYSMLGQQIGTVEGVADIQTFGYPYAVRIKVDPESLAAKGISLTDLANVIDRANPDEPTGKFYGPDHSVTTITEGQLTKADLYNSLIIKYENDQPVRISDIGYSYGSLQNDKQNFQWVTKDKTESVVVLPIYKMNGYNTVKVCENIKALVSRLRSDVPASMELHIPFSQDKWILEAVNDVELTLIVAFFLVVAVVFIYLGKFRNSIIPLITLPITLCGTFILMYFFNYSLDILSLSAFTLAIGFLVDDAIVVLENIVRWVQNGESPFQGAIKGSGQIALTILSISLCLAAVFLPMLLMPGILGEIFHEFAAVILIAVLISGFISLSLTPMLCSRFIPPYEQEHHPPLEKASLKLNEFLLSLYKPVLNVALKHRVITLFIAIFCIGASYWIFTWIPRSFLPPNDLGIVQAFVQAPEETSPERMQEYLNEFTEIVIRDPSVETVARIDSYPSDNQAIFFVNLVESNKRKDIWTIMEKFNQQFQDVVGAVVFQKAFPLINLQIGSTATGKANFQYMITSFDEKALYESAEELMNQLYLRPELANVSSDMQINSPYVRVSLLRDQARSYEMIDATDIENALQYAYGETYISKINLPINMYYVILEVANQFDRDPSQLDKLYVVKDGNPVAIKSIINAEMTNGPSTVNHINTLTSVTISFDNAPNVPLSEAVQAIEEEASKILPENVDGALAGNTAEFAKSNRALTWLLILAIFIIYIILGILYENFLHPFTAISAIPVAALGGLLTLIIVGESLSVYAFIGIIMLLGIVMKNGILIVDFSLEAMEKKKCTAVEAAYEASIIRFRPIIMTTLAAMMGAVPVALGIGGTVAETRAPLGMVVVGGLIFSQLVTLFVTPVVFIFVCELQDWMQNRFDIFKPHHHFFSDENDS